MEAQHELNIWNLGTGTFICGTALVSFSFMVGLNSLFDVVSYVNSGIVILLALCVAFAMGARTSMIDLWRTMENNTKLTIVVMLGIIFSFGYMAPHENSVIAGLLSLHFPAAITLLSERGFARLYLLAAVTCCFSVLGWHTNVATAALAITGLLIFVTMSYETFFFRVISQPVSTRVNGWLPLLMSTGRFILFAVPAWLLWRFVPSPRPFLTFSDLRSSAPRERVAMDPDSFNMALLKAFLYTMALVLLLLGLIAVLRYLHSKFKRKRGELLPESIGVPVGSLQRLPRPGKDRRRERADDPLDQIVKDYERFSTGFRSDLARRDPPQTPAEFAKQLRNLAALPASLIEEITSEFSDARYTADDVSWESADHFAAMVDKAMRTSNEELEST